MSKAEMIWAIIGEAKSAAILRDTIPLHPNQPGRKPFDAGDMFFTLAFRTDDQLRAICRQLRIAK